MGFSLAVEGLLRSKLPDAPWRPLIAKLGYASGFVLVILGRQQLFTENTLTPILPLLHKKDGDTLMAVARLWMIVLFTNIIGGVIVAWAMGQTEAFDDQARVAFAQIGAEALKLGFPLVLLRGINKGRRA